MSDLWAWMVIGAFIAGTATGAGLVFLAVRFGVRLTWNCLGHQGNPLHEDKPAAIDQEETE